MVNSERLDRLEEEVAHLTKSNEELSQQLFEQWKEIDFLRKTLKNLESQFEALETANSAPKANEKPPHW